jgi:hypothetical protein
MKFMRIKVSGELGTVVMSLAVIGLYYGAASFLIENVILRNLTEEENSHRPINMDRLVTDKAKNGMNIF